MNESPMNEQFSRRLFLRTVSAGSVVTVLAPNLVLSARAAEPPAKADGKPVWTSLFDGKTLDGWKSADFSRPGKVFVRDGAIVMEKGEQMTGVTYSRGDFPKIDYEAELEGKKIAGDDFFCTTTFPVDKTFCSFVVGGWGGTTVGLSSINSADASENETSTAREFKHHVWYRVRIRVTAKRIQAWIDDTSLVDLGIEHRKISTRIECNACKPFGVATWCTTGAVRGMRVRLLTAEEKKADRERKAVENE
jgi:hypothetical protein